MTPRTAARRVTWWRSRSAARSRVASAGACRRSWNGPRRRIEPPSGDDEERTMIQMTTVLDAADNSGARRLFCIKVLKGTKARYAGIGDLIKVSIKEAIPNSKVKKGDVFNAVVLDNQLQPIGTRIFGPVTRELRGEQFMRIVSLAPEVL